MKNNLHVHDFNNPYTLNVFSDASTHGPNTCYGAVAVIEDNVIDELYRIRSNATANAGEIRGLRLALVLADQYKIGFKQINIFCDSQLSILGLREYYPYKWKADYDNHVLLTKYGSEVINQEVFIENYNILSNIRKFVPVGLFCQKGHVNLKSSNSLNYALHVFKTANRIPLQVDMNLIKYISKYNGYIDVHSRNYLKKYYDSNNIYYDPISFSI